MVIVGRASTSEVLDGNRGDVETRTRRTVTSSSTDRPLREVILACAGVTLAISLLYHLQGVGFVRQNLSAIVAAIFLVLPQILLRKRGNIEAYGFTARPLRQNLLLLAITILAILPLFAAGFVVFHRTLCLHFKSLAMGSCAHILHPNLRV